MKKGYLLLSDGTCFSGRIFGNPSICCGELVFNTSMTGYSEILTDPSYNGQIVLMTYPLIGNYGVDESWKEAVFSFDRFVNVDPQLGPEMRSTGEVVGLGRSFGEAYAKSQIGAGNVLPTEGKVIISVNKKDRKTIVPIALALQKMGFSIAATRGTARDLFEEGVLTDVVLKTHDGHPNIVDMIRAHRAALVINTPMGFHSRKSDDEIRSEAMRNKVPYTTTTSAASAAVEAIRYLERKEYIARELPNK